MRVLRLFALLLVLAGSTFSAACGTTEAAPPPPVPEITVPFKVKSVEIAGNDEHKLFVENAIIAALLANGAMMSPKDGVVVTGDYAVLTSTEGALTSVKVSFRGLADGVSVASAKSWSFGEADKYFTTSVVITPERMLARTIYEFMGNDIAYQIQRQQPKKEVTPAVDKK